MKKISNWFGNHWLFYSIFIFLPSLLALVLFILSSNIAYLKNTIIWMLVGVLYLVQLVIILIANYRDYKNEHLTKKLLTSINMMCYDELYDLQSIIKRVENSDIAIFPFTDPEIQIKRILKSIVECLSNICDIEQDKFNIGIMYEFNEDNHWRWISGINHHIPLPEEDIVKNPLTAAYQVASKHSNFVFYNDKKFGIKEFHYIPDIDDATSKGIGSILCYGVSVQTIDDTKVKTYANSVLCINTYGQKFVESNWQAKKHLEENLRNILLPQYSNRLQIALASLYIKHLSEQHNHN